MNKKPVEENRNMENHFKPGDSVKVRCHPLDGWQRATYVSYDATNYHPPKHIAILDGEITELPFSECEATIPDKKKMDKKEN